MEIDNVLEVAKLVHHQSISKKQKRAHHPKVGLVYDDRMCLHFDPKVENPEKPDRIKAIWAYLKSQGITKRCLVMKAKEAEDGKITLVHKQKYVDLIKNLSSKSDSRKRKMASKFDSIYFSEGSSQSAYLAAGAVIEVSEKIAKGELDSAVAIVRPPGHHAEADKAMGFCIFNNVAIAASVLINHKPELGISKILIVDWDVHHGNGTQKMFWQDPRVLVFNVHRHDFGKFYPFTNDGSHSMIGEGSGTGYNVNVPWEQGECGDADYLAVWDHVLIPITKAFNPDIILISGGFDAAAGDTMGGCSVTPNGYSVMMKKLMPFARGRIMMALEGGYNLKSLSRSVLACVEALLENKPIIGSSKAEASLLESTRHVIEEVRKELSRYWPMLRDELPNTIKRRFLSEIEKLRKSYKINPLTSTLAILRSLTDEVDAEEMEAVNVKGKGKANARKDKSSAPSSKKRKTQSSSHLSSSSGSSDEDDNDNDSNSSFPKEAQSANSPMDQLFSIFSDSLQGIGDARLTSICETLAKVCNSALLDGNDSFNGVSRSVSPSFLNALNSLAGKTSFVVASDLERRYNIQLKKNTQLCTKIKELEVESARSREKIQQLETETSSQKDKVTTLQNANQQLYESEKRFQARIEELESEKEQLAKNLTLRENRYSKLKKQFQTTVANFNNDAVRFRNQAMEYVCNDHKIPLCSYPWLSEEIPENLPVSDVSDSEASEEEKSGDEDNTIEGSDKGEESPKK